MSRRHRDLVLEDAREEIFANSKSDQSSPKAIILAGQPGAGKSGLKNSAIEELRAKGGYAVIDPDELREAHPRYRLHAAEDYRTSASKVHPDASEMAKELRQEAITERRNLIIDGTLNDPEKASRLCRDLKAAGYEVDVRALAVNERTSQRQVAKRLEEDLAAQETGNAIPRDVPEDIQKNAYKGMPSAVGAVEASGFADRVRVYGRLDSVQPLYDSHAPQGRSAESAILAERNREMTPVEKAEHARGWDKVVDAAESRFTADNVSRRPSRDELLLSHKRRELAHGELSLDDKASALYQRDQPAEREVSPERFGREVEACRRASNEARLASYDPAANARLKALDARMDAQAGRAAKDPRLLDGITDAGAKRDIEKRMPQEKTAVLTAEL